MNKELQKAIDKLEDLKSFLNMQLGYEKQYRNLKETIDLIRTLQEPVDMGALKKELDKQIMSAYAAKECWKWTKHLHTQGLLRTRDTITVKREAPDIVGLKKILRRARVKMRLDELVNRRSK
jgi:hypothetical protein